MLPVSENPVVAFPREATRTGILIVAEQPGAPITAASPCRAIEVPKYAFRALSTAVSFFTCPLPSTPPWLR